MRDKKSVTISGKKLLALRRRMALSQVEFGREIELSDARVRQIEGVERAGIFPSTLRGLAKLMSLTPEQVEVALAPEPANILDLKDLNVVPYSERDVPEIPLFDWPIAAGVMTPLPEVEENDQRQQLALKHKRFRVHIRGESMEKEYADGCIVEFICLQWKEGQVAGLEVGKDFYVQAAEEMTFKRLKSITDEELIFTAINRKKFPKDIRVKRVDVNRMAKAEAIIQPKG